MWTKQSKETRLRQYDRLMLRSAFVSLFWTAITERKRRFKFTLQELARLVGTNKSAVSRWFRASPPNWTIDTIADIAGALNLELTIEATDRTTGTKFSASGPVAQSAITSRQVRTETNSIEPPVLVNWSNARRAPETSSRVA